MKEIEDKLNNKNEKLCVKLLARTKISPLCPVAYRLIKITDLDGKESKVVLLPAVALVSILELKKNLLKFGHNPDVSKDYWISAHEEVIKKTDNIIILCNKPGFFGSVYLRANDKIIGGIKSEKPILHPSVKNHLPVEIKLGTLKMWKLNVATYALYSSRFMLALCCGCSGFILKILGIEGGGFHLWGMSSIGKTSSAGVVASLAGFPPDITVLWNNTDKGLEEIAVAHNDSFLVLDESKLLDKDPLSAAKIMQNRVYTLSGGKGKTRSAMFDNQVSEWQVSIFSTGELSLAQHAEAGKIERLEGENVRVIDVPADAGHGMGIFELLPEGIKSANECVHVINDATHSNYGSAKPVYLKRLVEDYQNEPVKLKRTLEKGIAFFLEKNNVDLNSGIKARFAKRFAVAYVAGCMAIKYGVLPFTKQDILNGISKCYHDSLDKPCSPEPDVSTLLSAEILNVLKSSDRLNMVNNDGLNKNLIKNTPVVICKVKKKKVLAVDAKIINEIMSLKTRKVVLRRLTQKNILLSDSQKEYSTVQISYEGKVIDRRYCFVLSKLTGLLSD